MITIRKMEDSDIPHAVAIWLASGKQEYSYLPLFQQLTTESAADVFVENIFETCETWIAESVTRPVAFAALDGNTLERLYVHPSFQRKGIGNQLLRFCLELRPGGLRLYTHQENTRARRFYESFGFRIAKFGISPPPESVPDVEYIYGEPSQN